MWRHLSYRVRRRTRFENDFPLGCLLTRGCRAEVGGRTSTIIIVIVAVIVIVTVTVIIIPAIATMNMSLTG